MLLIKNGYLIDPASETEGIRDILIQDGRICRIAEKLEGTGEACEVIDATGLTVLPGLVDVHVHFRDPGFTYKEDIDTGAAAAARGGVTTVVLMANTKPAVDQPETLQYVLEKGSQTGIHVKTCANVTVQMKGEQLTDMDQLAALGAVGFTDDGIPLMREEIVREAMNRCAKLGLPISFHEEDPTLIENNGVNRGKASAYFGIGGSPREAEISLVKRDLELALSTGACVEIQHISTKEAVELVRQAKKRGGDIHAEATPHHFTLTEEAVIQYGTNAKMNPPLRTEEDRLAIIRGLQDGTIDIIATDHAPHAAQEKAREITQAPSGIIGLETALPLAITTLVKGGYLTLREAVRKMSTNPAAMYHLDAGYLAEGGPADLILVDPDRTQVFETYASKSANTPFTGQTLTGVVEMTICKGKVIFRREG